MSENPGSSPAQLDRSWPRDDRQRRLRVMPARRVISRTREANWPVFSALLVVAGVLLVLACANVANVLFAKALTRRRELAVRAALRVEGHDEPVTVASAPVGPRYLETLGIRLLRGRRLDERDVATAGGAVMVNQALVDRFFADGQALGRRVWLPDPEGAEERSFRIVGVVADVRYLEVEGDPEPMVYFSYPQHGYDPKRGAGIWMGVCPTAPMRPWHP